MVSRRNLISILVMMAVLVALFQFVNVLRDISNQYDKNTYISEDLGDVTDIWKPTASTIQQAETEDRDYVIYVGNSSSDMSEQVKLFCEYSKYNYVHTSRIASLGHSFDKIPILVVIESEDFMGAEALETLKELRDEGTPIVLGEIKNSVRIAEDEDLKSFLGIRSVFSDDFKINGVMVFQGLFLGGNQTYEVIREEDERRQDFDISIPWYRLGYHTEVYMYGLINNDILENEDYPAIMWRFHQGDGNVFAVVGDYLKGDEAYGILHGMIAQANPYHIYPVVNSKVLSVADFPYFSDENNEMMQQEYSQTISAFNMNFLWPALDSILARSNLKMTFFAAAQKDYEDSVEPKTDNATFYLKQFNEMSGEVGASLANIQSGTLTEASIKDQEFFQEAFGDYQLNAGYVDEDTLAQVENGNVEGILADFGTVTAVAEDRPVFSYLTDTVTFQKISCNVADYTFHDDMKMRSLQTGLGYSNGLVDVGKVYWPEDEDDTWQKIQIHLSSNLLAYWEEFSYFDDLSISESDARIRNFLNLDYSAEKQEEQIDLSIENVDQGYFMLRLNQQEIDEVIGGTFEELEEGFYLIETENTHVTITLKKREILTYE